MNWMLKAVGITTFTLAYGWLAQAVAGSNQDGWLNAVLSLSCLAVLFVLVAAFFIGGWNDEFKGMARVVWTALAILFLFAMVVLHLALSEGLGPNDAFWFNATHFGSWMASSVAVVAIFLMAFDKFNPQGFVVGSAFITANLVITVICAGFLPPFIPRPLVPVIWLVATIVTLGGLWTATEPKAPPPAPVVNNDD